MKSGVYCIRNIVNNKMYIGYSNNMNLRKSSHFSLLKDNKHDNNKLQKSYNKYGKNNFEFEIIGYYEDIDFLLPEMEHYWCILFNVHDDRFGYNIRPTDPLNKIIMSQETKDKISISHKGKKLSKETVSKIIATKKSRIYNLKGRKLTKEHKLKISIANAGKQNSLGFKHSENTKKLWSLQRKGKKLSEETKMKISNSCKNKKNFILQLDLNENPIKIFLNAKVAASEIKGNSANIITCCKGRQKTAYGYKWRYV